MCVVSVGLCPKIAFQLDDLQPTRGILVHLDTIWIKFKDQGHMSKFKVMGGKRAAQYSVGMRAFKR